MPRDISGNYTLPAGNPVIDNTIIETSWANPTMSDIAVQLNGVITRDGLLGPTAPIRFPDGTLAEPAVSWAAEPSSGWFRKAASTFALGIGSQQALQVSRSGGNNTYLFSNDTNSAGAGANAILKVAGASAEDPRLGFTVQGATDWSIGVDNSDSDKFKLSYSDTLGTNDRITVSSSGVVSIVTSAPKQSPTAGSPSILAVERSSDVAGITAYAYSASANAGGMLTLGRSKSGTLGTLSTTQNGDTLGWVAFEGVNTSNALGMASYIQCQQTGTAGSTYIPSELQFYTSGGTSMPQKRVTIDKTGALIVDRNTTGVVLALLGTNTSEGSNLRFGTDAADNPNVMWQDFNWFTGNARYEFRQSGTPVISYNSSGEVMVGTTTAIWGGAGSLTLNGSSNAVLGLGINNANTAYIYTQASGTQIGTFTGSSLSLTTSNIPRVTISASGSTTFAGSVYFAGSSTTGSGANCFLDSGDSNRIYRSTSSVRYKTDIRDLPESRLSVLHKLRPILYKSLADRDDKTADWYGFIAEEVAEVEPQLVQYGRESPEGPLVPDGVQYDRISVLLVAEVQRLMHRIEVLEGKPH